MGIRAFGGRTESSGVAHTRLKETGPGQRNRVRRNARRFRPGILAALFACLCSAAPAADAKGPRLRDFSVLGYLGSWTTYGDGFAIADIDASRLTHILYAFGAVNASGRAELGDACADIGECGGTGDGGNFARLVELKVRYPHLKVMISMGGWNGSEHFSRISANEDSRRLFVRSVIETFIETYPDLFDGVDIDWEYPVEGGLPQNGRSPADRPNFTLLMREFRTQLDAAGHDRQRRYGLSVALAADAAMVGNVELLQLAGIVDTLNVMTYDYHAGSSYTHFNAPLYAVENDPTPLATIDASVKSFLLARVHASKLILGIPFYGRAYGGVDAVNDGLLRPGDPAAVPDWASDGIDSRTLSKRRPEESGYRRWWNDRAQAPFLYNRDDGLWISYEDRQSVAAKIAYARQRALAGVMIWQLGGDDGTLLSVIEPRKEPRRAP